MTSGPSTPLAGLTVLELGTSIAGPSAAMILAELGAEVVKIEQPESGDDARRWGPPFAGDASTVFNAYNRNKRSAVVDLKDPAQLAALKRFMIERADIVVQNLKPGLVKRLGVDGETIRAAKPSIIYCNIGAFGAVGPLKERAGYDPLMQAACGIMSITGEEGRPPVRVGPSLVDQGAGMWAVIGILSALHRLRQCNEGTVIDTSLYETGIAWLWAQLSTFGSTGRAPGRIGTENAGIAPYKAFEAADGWVVIAAGNDALFARLVEVLDRPDLLADVRFKSNPDRVRNRDTLNAMIAQIIVALPRSHWLENLAKAGVPCSPVLNLAEVVDDPQFSALGMLQKASDSDLSLVGLPLSFDGKRSPLRSSPPALGEGTALVLSEKKSGWWQRGPSGPQRGALRTSSPLKPS